MKKMRNKILVILKSGFQRLRVALILNQTLERKGILSERYYLVYHLLSLYFYYSCFTKVFRKNTIILFLHFFPSIIRDTFNHSNLI